MSEFIDHLRDVFRQFGPIEARRMFGGYGVYHDGLMFGLIVDETLYLKADEGNAQYFRAMDLPQFEYLRRGKPTRLSYYRAPDDLMDDPSEAALWARRSFEAALRGRRG
ncbi:MAG: TfoX/Sxy family protein [Gammaproteobacteria bacterium]|nr:TfoX/Sxy family protein [Gammaproteobacteria bacterium]